jgi:tetratricopeptide (TPR) repeat protein
MRRSVYYNDGVHRLLIIFSLLLLSSLPSFAQQGISFSAAPAVSVPTGGSADLYQIGAGAELEVNFPLNNQALSFFGQFQYQNVQLQSDAGSLHILQGGGGLDYTPVKTEHFSFGPRLGAGGYLGYFQESPSVANPYWSAGLGGRLNLGKGFGVSLVPEYRSLLTGNNGQVSSLYSGVSVSLKLSIEPQAMQSGTRRPKLRIMEPAYRQIFPVIYKHYDKNPVGTVLIRNEESRSIDDVVVTVFVPSYMDGPQTIAEFEELLPGEERSIPITALFQNSVLSLTERDSAQSQITVNYSLSNSSLTAQRSSSLRIYDRNSISWDDDRKAAAFVTAKDPTILKFSRNVSSSIGSLNMSLVNENLADAIGLFEALKAYGLEYTIDPDSSYAVLSQDENLTDYLQFPVQTLDYKSGDCDDLTILYSSMLEAVAVETAFVTTPGHIFLAFSLDLDEAGARRVFNSTEGLIIAEGKAWMPVETTLLNQGFLKAWEAGAKQWREASLNNANGFFPVRDAWSVYEPTWFGSDETNTVEERLPAAATIVSNFRGSMNQFVQVQISPMVQRLEEAIARRPSPRLVNQLGTLYARYGLIEKAEEQFRKAAQENYMPSFVNLGNVFYLNEDYISALRYYERAYAINPDNTDVLLSLARVKFEVEQYAEAREYYEIAELLDPARADRFSYITGGGTAETARASNTGERSRPLWSEE